MSREFGERSLALGPNDPPALGVLALLENEVGDSSKGRHYLERLLEVMAVSPPGARAAYSFPVLIIPLAARINGRDDLFEVATEAAHVVLSSTSAPSAYTVTARAGLGFMAAYSADAESAREQYTALRHEGGKLTVLTASVDRLLGLLVHTMGEPSIAVTHFEDALEFCRKAGYRPELAWTCCDYADALLQRAGDGDRSKATSLLDESLAISSELGMRPLMERVLSRREILRA